MSTIVDYWTHTTCVMPTCDDPPMDGRDVCKYHDRCHASTTASWLDCEAS